jgi:three-Cys-motif partner protein
MNDFEQFYDGREQTLVKHSVLKRYLQRFAYIIGSSWNSITYVDCFSGPWNERSSTFSDTSFAIAIEQLRTARQQLSKDFRIR